MELDLLMLSGKTPAAFSMWRNFQSIESGIKYPRFPQAFREPPRCGWGLTAGVSLDERNLKESFYEKCVC